MMRVAIIGGGPAGLLTAYRLEQRAGAGITITLFEAGHRLGGKIRTRRFDAAPVLYEAGVAECYDYAALGHDPLRQLITDLGLTPVPTHSTAVMLNGRLIKDEGDIGRHFGKSTHRAIETFQGEAAAMLPLSHWYRGFGDEDNQHPWARRTVEDVLDRVDDPIARKFLKVGAHSDMATEPHLANGLIGLRNFLKAVSGYGAQYSIAGGMEQLPRRLAESLSSTRIELGTTVTGLSKRRSGSYEVSVRRGRSAVRREFDAVVLALPYNHLPAIEMGGERLRRAAAAHVAHYDSPGHYLRVSVLFERPFWRATFGGSWIMLDAFGGCCVYDESERLGERRYGVLGWLLAGADALRHCNEDDRTLVARVLDSLPDELYGEACARFIEARVHRWAGAVSGQPGGFPLRPPHEAHQLEPIDHPGLAVVGDYLFDSTLNGVLRSATIATDLLLGLAPEHPIAATARVANARSQSTGMADADPASV